MDDRPPEAKPPAPEASQNSFGLLIFGLVVGFPVGGLLLTFALFFSVTAIASEIGNQYLPFLYGLCFLIAAAAIVFGVVTWRKSIGFMMGLAIGIGAGLLGGMALCSVIGQA